MNSHNLFSRLFGWSRSGHKKRGDATGFSRQKSQQRCQKTFILEPIEARSGIIGTDDNGDLGLHVDLLHPGVDIFHPDAIALPNEHNLETGHYTDVTPEIDPIASNSTLDTHPQDNGNEAISLLNSVDKSTDISTSSEPLHLTSETPDNQLIHEVDSGIDKLTDVVHNTDVGNLALADLSHPNHTFDSGVFKVGENGKVDIDFLGDYGGYQGQLAIFSLEGMDKFEPGSHEFIQEAAHRALSDSVLGHVVISDQTEGAKFSGFLGEADQNSGEYLGVKTFDMRPGDQFGLMLVPNGQVQQVFDNPEIGGAVRPLFSLVTANPNQAFHTGQIADVTGDGSIFVFEDLRVDTGSDHDYNDIIFQVHGATGKAVHLDDVIDPAKDWRTSELGQELLHYAVPTISHPVQDMTLTPDQSTASIDLSHVFTDPEGQDLHYEIIDGNSEGLDIKLEGDHLTLETHPDTSINEVAIRATDSDGNSIIHTWSVTTNNLSQESVKTLDTALNDLAQVDLHHLTSEAESNGLETFDNAIAQVETVLQQHPNLVQFLDKPESLSQLGISDTGVETAHQLLANPEMGEMLGLPTSIQEALHDPNPGEWDLYLSNAQNALSLLPEDASAPPIAFLDFTEGQHAQQVTQVFESVNPVADYDTLPIDNGNWAQQLITFVDKLKASGETHGVANLSFDLSQLDDIGITTRYELTPLEYQAIKYAADNHVLLVVASGNTGGVMSALGEASQDFDNIITVGAVNQFEAKADYSGYGEGLTIMAPGGAWDDDPKAFVGTSRSTAYVTAAVSLVWAANPDLSFNQVKDLLINTAVDLNTPGWDEKTGAGLIDIKEAISRAQLIEPKTSTPTSNSQQPTTFSGEGRVITLARQASDATEKVIADLENTQETLLENWQTLVDLGNPNLSLIELEEQVKDKINAALDKYKEDSTASAIAKAQFAQWVEALTLATSHYQIEQTRLQQLQLQQKQLEAQLAALGEQKTALESETQNLLENIKQQITQAESDLAKAQAKLLNPFADVDDNLQTDSAPWLAAAKKEQEFAVNFQQQATVQTAQKQAYQELAASINPNRWQVIGTERSRSGRSQEIWGWGKNPQLLQQQQQYNFQAQIAANNIPLLQQFAQQAEQQSTALNSYAEFLNQRKNNLDIGAADVSDAAKISEFLQQQLAEKEKIADNYAQEVGMAEARRLQNQNLADWHNSQINRWEVIGTRRKRSGKTEDVYGWVYYPQHIAPRNQAQELANQAAQEKEAYQQLAFQARQQADALKEQLRKLQERIGDWSVLKQGIDYEITADQLRLQGNQDLLDLYDPVQQQKLQTLNSQIQQTESELNRIVTEKLPTQQELTDVTAQRLQETQAEIAAIQKVREEKDRNLQTFLETSGFLLPYRERLAAIQKRLDEQESEKLQVLLTMQQLTNQILQTPSDSLSQQLNYWRDYLEKLEQDLAWSNLQKDQLALALADSPERLAIASLIKELATDGVKVFSDGDGFDAKSKIDFLKSIEGGGASFLSGFDNLTQRLSQAKSEESKTEESLAILEENYRNFGLAKAELEDKTIPAKEEEIVAKEEDMIATEDAIAQTKSDLAIPDGQLTDLPSAIATKETEIQEQQSILADNRQQIADANAVVNNWEQQRQDHQNAANYWNSQIYTWGVISYGKKGKPNYGWIYNPQAEANRSTEQSAANNAAQQRDLASQEAQNLTATLQPQIAATQEQIDKLEKEKQLLVQLSQLNAQLSQQQQQRDTLVNELANLNQQQADLEQQLIDKYREIELTDKYLVQVKAEVNRLESRLDLLNKAGILEQQYQDNWSEWQEAIQTQVTATTALLETREAGAGDRNLFASLQSQLAEAETKLQQAKKIQQSIADTQQAEAFTQLQLGNQQLLLQSLVDRDPSLAEREAYYLNQAQIHVQKMWYWNGKEYAYNTAESAAYRSNLQLASFIADQRNKLWQETEETKARINELTQKLSQQQSQITTLESELSGLGQVSKIEAQVNSLQAEINTVSQRLSPLQIQENQQSQVFQNAVHQAQTLTTDLIHTTELQSQSLRQLIGFGILASESDVDFFATEVEPQVKNYIDKLRERVQDIAAEVESASALTTNWEEQLANTTDEVSKEALRNLINKSQAQLTSLAELKEQSQTEADELEELLNQAITSLTPLRQKQELEIRQKLESNNNRLDAFQSQLNSENAADTAIKDNTVLAYAQLNDQIRQDLTNGVTDWTNQLLDGHQITKDLGNSQQQLSQSVDDLIAYITGNLAQPDGDYHQSASDLRDGITTLGVLENRADALDSSVSATEDGIERIKLRIQQDAELWKEIAPIVMRYGVESEQLKEYLQMPGDAKTRRAAFLAKYPENGTAIDLLTGATLEGSNPNEQISSLLNVTQADILLNAEAVEGRNPNQQLYDKAKAEQASHEAQGYALLSQAAWYEQQAAYHWSVSRKNGPTWIEWRRVCKRSWFRKKCWDEAVTHVDYNWIIWSQYSQLFPQLRQQGESHLTEADKWRKEKERLEPLAKQWTDANNAANLAEPPIKEARNFLDQLEVARESIPADEAQLASLENLLPIIQEELEKAEAEAEAQNAKVRQEWQEYDTNSEEYRIAIADILQRRGELNQQAIETQQKLAETEQWVERQSVALGEELASTLVLTTNLQEQRQLIQNQIRDLSQQGVTVDGLEDLYTKDSQLAQSLDLLTNKVAILTAQQTALSQKRSMLAAQNEVILAEQKLLDAYIKDPDADYSNLQQQLQDARAALAEAQRLAEEAEAASKIITAPLQQLKEDLLVQNDEHLQEARAHQQILQALVEATQSNVNYTLQAAQKQQEVNNLEFQILQRLQEATAAGYQEAKHLLDVAKYNDIATAAEIYYRDYRDLASDRGKGGIGNANDRMLADSYYQEMLANRELQRRAQAQVNAFHQAKETAESQMKTLQAQQETAAKLLNDLNAKIAETQEEREKKEQELAIAQARLDGITRIREQTEQTFIQLVTIEKLNLAQAQLEQEIAQNRQTEIDQAVQDRMERDRLELERKRLETTAKIEQLKQLQAEDNLRQNLNQARGQLGLDTLEPTEDSVQLQTQLAGLLTSLKDLETQQPDLPDDLKALLAEVRGDIHLALQGKEASVVQDNLIKAMEGLIGQVEQYKTEINRIDLEEQWDNQLLQTAQQDLQGASQELLKELQRAEELGGERLAIDPLYLEVLHKVALAEQAVDISNDLAQQGKQMLDQIIKQRIAERKARKKSFWNKILGIVSTVLSLVGAVLTFVPGANLIGLALGAIGGAINSVQAAINGDWMGAIFSAVMAGASFVGGAIGNALKAGKAIVMGMSQAVAQKVFSTIKAFQSLASGAFNGVRNLLSGDKIMGFLQIIGGLAGAATSGISGFVQGGLSGLSDLGKFGYKVLDSLSKAPTLIYGGIKAIQSGDWVSGIGNIIKGVVSLGKTWTNDFNDGSESPGEKIANILENISSVGIGVSKFITGGLEGLLEGLGDILDGLGDDIQKWVANLIAGGNCDCPCPCPEEDEEDIEEIAQEIFDEILEEVNDSDLTFEEKGKALVKRLAERLQDENIAPELKAQVINNLETTKEQAKVIRSLPSSQQQEVFHNLPEATQKEWAKTYFQAQYNQDQQSTNSSIDITNPIFGNVDPITGQLVLTGHVQIVANPILDFVWGALQGEFNQNPSFGQVILDTLIGMFPIVGDVGDVRDLTGITIKLKTHPEERTNYWNYVAGFGAIVGFVPLFGSPVKAVLKNLQSLALGKAIKKFDNVLQLSDMTADQANVVFIRREQKPPYAKNTLVTDIIFKSDPQDLVRVHGEKNQVGSWLMRRQDIEGLTPAQIKDKFALPSMPKYVSDVRGLEGMTARVGVAGRIDGYGSGGGVQIELLGRVNEGNFINRRELP